MNRCPDLRAIAAVITSLLALVLAAPARAATEDSSKGLTSLAEVAAHGQMPKPIKREAPSYPRGMRDAGISGSVAVNFVIDAEGRVINPYVVSSTNPWFERPALTAISQWRFEPARLNGQPVAVEVQQKLEFSTDWGSGNKGLWWIKKPKDKDKLPEEIRWDIAPEPTMTAFAVYPFEKLQAGERGQVRLGFIIGPDGRIATARVEETTAPEFGAAALAMIDGWRFTAPAKNDGTKCSAAVSLKVEFLPSGEGDVPVLQETKNLLRWIETKSDKIVPLKELDGPPRPLSRRPPVYPTALRKQGLGGGAVIEFYIDVNGDAQLPRVISATAPEFGYAAAQAIATWRFEPLTKHGHAVAARVRVPMDFKVPVQAEAAPAEKK